MRKALFAALLFFVALPLAAATKKERERTVTLDVKDEDVHVVLASLKQQCGVKNLVVDKDVQGRATFYFVDVPCSTAFATVFRTFGITGAYVD